MPFIRNTFVIGAPPPAVWAALVDTERYAEWNPRLLRIEGAFVPGAVVALHYRKDRAWMPARFVVDVTACVPERELRFGGPRHIARALVRASHYFRLAPHADGTELTHGEDFAGVLAGAVWPVLGPIVATNHADVNAALRRRCER